MAVQASSKTMASARDQVAERLAALLGDTFVLYVKTHGFHWNVTGAHFRSLHLMLEEQYQDLWQALDTIAERMRALDAIAPGSAQTMTRLSTLNEATGKPPEAMEMLRLLIADHETLLETARSAVSTAEEAEDGASVDLVNDRIDSHEKMLWMLRSTLV